VTQSRNCGRVRIIESAGYGPALMEAAEREALVRGCIQIVLITRRFQAPPEICVHSAI
jgi:hypothetical protein